MLERKLSVRKHCDDLYLVFEVLGPEGGLRWEGRTALTIDQYGWLVHNRAHSPMAHDLVAHSKLPLQPQNEFSSINYTHDCDTTRGPCWSDTIGGSLATILWEGGSEAVLDHMEKKYKEFFKQRALAFPRLGPSSCQKEVNDG